MVDYTLSTENLIAGWQLDSTKADGARKLAQEKNGAPPMSRMLKAISAIGAFMSASFFMSFLGVLGIFDFHSPGSTAFWGVVFTLAALYFSFRSEERTGTFGETFVTQATLIMLVIGKVALLWALVQFFGSYSLWSQFFALALVTAVTYPFSRFTIDRYLSVLATILWGGVALVWGNGYENILNASWQVQWMGSLYFVLMLAVAALFFARPHYHAALKPMRDAVLTSLVVMMLVYGVGEWMRIPVPHARYFVSGALTLCLLAMTVWMAGGIERVKAMPLVQAACLGILLLGTLCLPGILLAIGFMVLGYGRHERQWLVTGGLLFAGFLSLFYYAMHMTLLEKSVALACSGAVLLVGSMYLNHCRAKEIRA